MRAFEKQAVDDFVDRTQRHLRETVPRCLDWEPEALRAQVRAGIECARKFKITTEQGVARLVVLVVGHLHGFEGSPFSKPMLNVLLAYGSSEGQKLDRLTAMLEAQNQVRV